MKTFCSFLIVYILYLLGGSIVYAQQYKWIKGGSPCSYGNAAVRHMCTDPHNNLYTTSCIGINDIKADSFYMPYAFNTGFGASVQTLLASYGCDGQMRWAKLVDASNSSYFSGIVADRGNIYFAEEFNFPSINKHIGYDTSFNCPFNNSLLAKFDTSGKLIWLRLLQPDTTGSYSDFVPKSIDLDAEKNIHVYTYAFTNTPLSTTVSTTLRGNYDIKFDSNGTVLSAVRLNADTNTTELVKAIVNKQNGNTLAFFNLYGTSSITERNYIAEFNASGTQLWADTTKLFDSTTLYSPCSITDIGIDEKGNPYFTGFGVKAFLIGPDTIYSVYNTWPDGPIDVIMKLDSLGHIKWYYDLTTPITAMAMLPNGKIAVTGDGGTVIIHGTDTVLPYPGDYDVPLLCIIDTAGNTILLDNMHGNCSGYGTAITCDNNNNVYLGGWVTDSLYADGLKPYVAVGEPQGDFFIAKYGSCNCSPGPDIASGFTKKGTDTVRFSYIGAPADSVRWYFGDGSISDSLNAIHEYKNKGTYTVCVTAYGCNDSAMYCDTVSAVEVPSLPYQTGKGAAVWPNPTHKDLILTLSQGEGTYLITDISGRVMTEGKINSPYPPKGATKYTTEIDVSGLAAGMYFLTVKDGNGFSETVKVVKE